MSPKQDAAHIISAPNLSPISRVKRAEVLCRLFTREEMERLARYSCTDHVVWRIPGPAHSLWHIACYLAPHIGLRAVLVERPRGASGGPSEEAIRAVWEVT